MHIDRRLLGWGLFFVLVGGIPLAVRANLLDESVVDQWPLLWPLLLIGWGVGLMLRNTPIDWLGGAIVAVTFGVMGGGLLVTGASGFPIATGCTSSGGSTPFADRTGNLDSTAEVDVVFNCGSLRVGAGDGSTWSLTGSDRDGHAPRVTSSTSSVSIESDNQGPFTSAGHAVWNVTIPRTPSVGFGVTLNAGEGTIDLSGANIGDSTVTLNAGKLDVNLGAAAQAGDMTAVVNAGAAAITLPAGERSLSVSINAGSLQLCLPAGAPMRVSWGGALGSNNFSAAGLTKVDDSTWTSAGFDAAQPHTELHASATAGSFELRLGGSCRA